jgi:hypothetical protein
MKSRMHRIKRLLAHDLVVGLVIWAVVVAPVAYVFVFA